MNFSNCAYLADGSLGFYHAGFKQWSVPWELDQSSSSKIEGNRYCEELKFLLIGRVAEVSVYDAFNFRTTLKLLI